MINQLALLLLFIVGQTPDASLPKPFEAARFRDHVVGLA